MTLKGITRLFSPFQNTENLKHTFYRYAHNVANTFSQQQAFESVDANDVYYFSPSVVIFEMIYSPGLWLAPRRIHLSLKNLCAQVLNTKWFFLTDQQNGNRQSQLAGLKELKRQYAIIVDHIASSLTSELSQQAQFKKILIDLDLDSEKLSTPMEDSEAFFSAWNQLEKAKKKAFIQQLKSNQHACNEIQLSIQLSNQRVDENPKTEVQFIRRQILGHVASQVSVLGTAFFSGFGAVITLYRNRFDDASDFSQEWYGGTHLDFQSHCAQSALQTLDWEDRDLLQHARTAYRVGKEVLMVMPMLLLLVKDCNVNLKKTVSNVDLYISSFFLAQAGFLCFQKTMSPMSHLSSTVCGSDIDFLDDRVMNFCLGILFQVPRFLNKRYNVQYFKDLGLYTARIFSGSFFWANVYQNTPTLVKWYKEGFSCAVLSRF